MSEQEYPKKVLMACGHTSQANWKAPDGTWQPACPVCDMPESITAAKVQPDFTGRKARCAYYGKPTRRCECSTCSKRPDRICHCEVDSSLDLAFFSYQPDKEFDKYYCGCHSWD